MCIQIIHNFTFRLVQIFQVQLRKQWRDPGDEIRERHIRTANSWTQITWNWTVTKLICYTLVQWWRHLIILSIPTRENCFKTNPLEWDDNTDNTVSPACVCYQWERCGTSAANLITYATAQSQITDFSRLSSVRFGMVTVLSFVWPRSLLLCPFHKKLRLIWKKKSFGFCQTDNPQFSFIMYCYTYRQLTCRNLEVSEFSFLPKSTKRKSLVIRNWDSP